MLRWALDYLLLGPFLSGFSVKIANSDFSIPYGSHSPPILSAKEFCKFCQKKIKNSIYSFHEAKGLEKLVNM